MGEADERLLAAAAAVDVLELAGAIIAAPRHARVSVAGGLALALAVERIWEIALEGELLGRAVQLQGGAEDRARAHAIETQAARVRALMDAITGKENGHGQHDA